MNNTEQRIALLQKQLDELKASLKEKKEDGLWIPDNSERERYYFIDTDGAVLDSIQDLSDWDYLFQNYFKTREQAERHAKRLKLYNKLWKLAEHLNGDWPPTVSEVWVVVYMPDSCEIEVDARHCGVEGFGVHTDPYYKSKDIAQLAISMLTDEEKEIFKNIYRP